MKALDGAMAAVMIPLMLLNLLGGIVSGGWLAFLGQWGTIGYGILFGIVGIFAISLVMLPGLIFAGPAMAFLKRGSRFGFLTFSFFNAVFQYAVLSTWCLLILGYFARRADSSTIVPTMIWSYTIATGAIAYLTQKDVESGNEYGAIPGFFCQVAYVIATLMVLLFNTSGVSILITFCAIALCGAIAQVGLSAALSRNDY